MVDHTSILETPTKQKVSSETEVALRYKLLTLPTLFTLLHCLNWFTLLKQWHVCLHILLVDWFALLNWSCLFVSTHNTKHCCQSKVSVFLLPVGTIPGLAWVSFSLVELVCSGLVMLVVVSYILVWVSYDLVWVFYMIWSG